MLHSAITICPGSAPPGSPAHALAGPSAEGAPAPPFDADAQQQRRRSSRSSGNHDGGSPLSEDTISFLSDNEDGSSQCTAQVRWRLGV